MPKRKRGNLEGKRHATRLRVDRENEDEDERVRRLSQQREYDTNARANESEEQRADRLSRKAAHARVIRANESEAQRSARLAQKADNARTTRCNESESEHAARISREADRYREYLATESPRERARRLAESNADSGNNEQRPGCSRQLFPQTARQAAVSARPIRLRNVEKIGLQTVDDIIESENPEFSCGASILIKSYFVAGYLGLFSISS